MSDARAAVLSQFTLRELLDEVEREVFMRRRVYPRQVAEGRMSQSDADRRIDMLVCVGAHLREAMGT